MWWTWAASPVLVVLFVLHASVSMASMQLLPCVRIAPETELGAYGQLRLFEDVQLRCDDPAASASRLGLALPVLLLWSLGLPLGVAFAMWAMRDRLRADASVQHVWGVLLEGFRADGGAYWWESAVMLRKLLLVVLVVALAPDGPVAQAAGALVAVLAALGLHAWVKPYASPSLNVLEAGGLVVVAIMVVSAQLLAMDARQGHVETMNGEGSSAAVTALILGSNICFLVAAAVLACGHAHQEVKRRVRRLKLTAWGPLHAPRHRVSMQSGEQSLSGTGTLRSPSVPKSPMALEREVLQNPFSLSHQSPIATLPKPASWRSDNDMPDESRVAFGFAPQRVEN